MRLDGPIPDLTEAQKKMAQIAGIPADRAGLGDEYPKMVYRPGFNARHQLENRSLKMGNGPAVTPDRLSEGYDNEIAYVEDAADEQAAIASGWFLSHETARQEGEVIRRAQENAKDDEIASLRAQLAAAQSEQGEPRRGPGRPRIEKPIASDGVVE